MLGHFNAHVASKGLSDEWWYERALMNAVISMRLEESYCLSSLQMRLRYVIYTWFEKRDIHKQMVASNSKK